MKKYSVFLVLVAALLALPAAWCQETVTAHVVVTALTRSGAEQPLIPRESVSVLEDGRPQDVSSWTPLRGKGAGLELVILLDDSSRSSMGLQLPSLKSFIHALPASAAVAIGYMRNGSPNLVQPLTTDHATAASKLRLPIGQPGISGSPYFCLSDLARHWPGKERGARREVILLTDGADPQWSRGYDPQDSYVLSAIRDAQRAGVIVYSIYYGGVGRRGTGAVIAGQNYLVQVSSATGGEAYLQGFADPVSVQPYLGKIQHNLQNQYELGFITAPSKELRRLKVKTTAPNVKLQAPEQFLARGAGAPRM